MRVPWHRQVLLCSCLLQSVEACFDSSGTFYCAKLWYFWFSVFWMFMLLLIGVMCICNHVNKKKAKVDIQYTLPPKRRTPRIAEEGKADLKSTTGTSEKKASTTTELHASADPNSSTEIPGKDASTTTELHASADPNSSTEIPGKDASTTELHASATAELYASATAELYASATTELHASATTELHASNTTESSA